VTSLSVSTGDATTCIERLCAPASWPETLNRAIILPGCRRTCERIVPVDFPDPSGDFVPLTGCAGEPPPIRLRRTVLRTEEERETRTEGKSARARRSPGTRCARRQSVWGSSPLPSARFHDNKEEKPAGGRTCFENRVHAGRCVGFETSFFLSSPRPGGLIQAPVYEAGSPRFDSWRGGRLLPSSWRIPGASVRSSLIRFDS